MPLPRSLLVFSFALLVPALVQGGDGRYEINQACAENGGCFAGDDAGFPVQITEQGSYVLTSNLQVPEDTHGIVMTSLVTASTIDLNGFGIHGPVSCTGSPVTNCAGSASGDGITGSNLDITVRNGTVSGMAGDGVDIGSRASVINLNATENGGDGVQVDFEALVRDVSADRNGDSGIDASRASTVVNSSARFNGAAGIGVNTSGVVVDSTALENGGAGFDVWAGTVVRGSTASENLGSGILFDGSASVINSSASRNDQYGINCDASGAVKGNVLNNNGTGSLNNCVEIAANYCNGSTSC